MNKTNKILLIVLVALLVVFLGNEYLGGPDSRNFKTTLVALDTATVDKIVLVSKTNGLQPVELLKAANGWQVSGKGINDRADKSVVKGMLNELANISPDRLLATSAGSWEENEVTDSLATRVKAYAGEELLADFYVGKFNFQAASRKMSTSVRLADDEDVYAVEGFLSSVFNRSLDDLRDKTFIEVEAAHITGINFSYPADSSFTLSKALQGWAIDGQAADSTAVENYLHKLKNIRPRKFADDFTASGQTPTYSLNITLSDGTGVTVAAYQAGEATVLHSSRNAGAWFTDEGLQIYDQLFVPRATFVPDKAGG